MKGVTASCASGSIEVAPAGLGSVDHLLGLEPERIYRHLAGHAQDAELDGVHRRHDRSKAAGRIASELMTPPAITNRPDATLGEAARLMHRRAVKRPGRGSG